MTELIGLAGYARAGKTTVGGILAKAGYHQAAFADPIRAMLYALNPVVRLDDDYGFATVRELVDAFGWEQAKTHTTMRRLLQRLGTEAGRECLGPTVWVDALFSTHTERPLVITDVRFPNEYHAITQRGGVMAWVSRPGLGPTNAHRSERGVVDFPFHAVLLNDGDLPSLALQVSRHLLHPVGTALHL